MQTTRAKTYSDARDLLRRHPDTNSMIEVELGKGDVEDMSFAQLRRGLWMLPPDTMISIYTLG
jgi:hypothetical protein